MRADHNIAPDRSPPAIDSHCHRRTLKSPNAIITIAHHRPRLVALHDQLPTSIDSFAPLHLQNNMAFRSNLIANEVVSCSVTDSQPKEPSDLVRALLKHVLFAPSLLSITALEPNAAPTDTQYSVRPPFLPGYVEILDLKTDGIADDIPVGYLLDQFTDVRVLRRFGGSTSPRCAVRQIAHCRRLHRRISTLAPGPDQDAHCAVYPWYQAARDPSQVGERQPAHQWLWT